MEEYNASKNHRIERNRRNKSALGDGKWLQRRFQRDAVSVQRMSNSLDVENMTDAPFYRTFFPDYMEKSIAKMGVNPTNKKKMTLVVRRDKKAKISKARARSRRTKINGLTSYFVHDEDTTSVPQNTSQKTEDTKAWEEHIELLETELTERTLMEVAVIALKSQANVLALHRGTNRKWSTVI